MVELELKWLSTYIENWFWDPVNQSDKAQLSSPHISKGNSANS